MSEKAMLFARKLTRRAKRHAEEEGFTLVELALAIIVVAIGVLAVAALISAGLDLSAKAIADTQSAIFADSLFNVLRCKSLTEAEQSTGDVDKFVEFWIRLRNNQTSVTVVADEAWGTVCTESIGGVGPVNNVLVASAGPHTLIYRHEDDTNLVSHVLRYDLDVDLLYGDTVQWSNRAMCTLRVWEGEFGSTADDNAIMFYSEFVNPGDL
ncbi:MAG: hypothetical protein E4H02_09325 [Lentisphaerales bacterium]|jgi:hypothetical protein|nr:MAG: hypothetical protein E4H02_09325 [Lentisphaerales bacterium]